MSFHDCKFYVLILYYMLQTLRSWPHYAILIDKRDYKGSRVTYVVQEQLELLKNTEVMVFIFVVHVEFSTRCEMLKKG